MNNRELQDWINQHGGVRNQGLLPGQKDTVPNPNYNQAAIKGPESQKTIPNPAMATVIITNDGSKVVLRQAPGSSPDPDSRTYQVDFSGKATPAEMGTTAAASSNDPGNAAADANAVALQQQREKNAALPPEQDPAYETDAERRARGRQTVLDQEAKAARDKAQADADAAKNKPSVSYKVVNGKTYKVLTYPDGREEVSESAIPTEPVKPDVRPDGQGGYVKINPDGTVTKVNVAGDNQTLPDDVTAPPNLNSENLLQDFSTWAAGVQKKVGLPPEAGGITAEQAKAAIAQRYALIQGAMAQQTSQANAGKSVMDAGLTQRGQDVSLVNQRLSAATSGTTSAAGQIFDMSKTMMPGNGAKAAGAFAALLEMQRRQAERMGGLSNPAAVSIPPALARLAGVQANGQALPTPQIQAPAMAPVQPASGGGFNPNGSSNPTGVPPTPDGVNAPAPDDMFGMSEQMLRDAGFPDDVIAAIRARHQAQIGAAA